MNIRNNKTGIIGELHFEPDKEYRFTVITEDPTNVMKYKKLTDLYADWEDVPEEPKEYWYIDTSEGTIVEHSYAQYKTTDKERKEIGNFFETEEEAEEAVEKLEAAKRLKDKGFKITGWAIYPLPDEFLDGKRIWYNTVLRGRIDFEVPLDNSKDIDKELEHFVTDEEGGE